MGRMITTEQLIPNAASKVARENSGNCGECAVVVLANGSIRHEPNGSTTMRVAAVRRLWLANAKFVKRGRLGGLSSWQQEGDV